MEEKIITCIICPSSCQISVTGTKSIIKSIEGYKCKRGMEYAETEYLRPVRNLTATVKANNYKSPVISVRTSKPISKELQHECMEIIKTITVDPPYYIGKIVYQNILNTGADIILTNQ